MGNRDRLEVIGGVAPLSKPKPSPEGLLLKDLLHEDLLKVMEEVPTGGSEAGGIGRLRQC